jgi:hypothetical protein
MPVELPTENMAARFIRLKRTGTNGYGLICRSFRR